MSMKASLEKVAWDEVSRASGMVWAVGSAVEGRQGGMRRCGLTPVQCVWVVGKLGVSWRVGPVLCAGR